MTVIELLPLLPYSRWDRSQLENSYHLNDTSIPVVYNADKGMLFVAGIEFELTLHENELLDLYFMQLDWSQMPCGIGKLLEQLR